MGHSEGGQATARSKHDAWTAQVISGWTCAVNGTPERGAGGPGGLGARHPPQPHGPGGRHPIPESISATL